jgi:hypothetical protein
VRVRYLAAATDRARDQFGSRNSDLKISRVGTRDGGLRVWLRHTYAANRLQASDCVVHRARNRQPSQGHGLRVAAGDAFPNV